MLIEAIFEWNMKPEEVEAYKLAITYDEEFRKLYPDADATVTRQNTVPMRFDPRKSNLFRHCWKLRRETRGLLEGSEYTNYIRANLIIIKLNHGRVGPNAICGDKAWIRYKVWKRHFDRKQAEASAKAPAPSAATTDPKLIANIDRTKKFIFEKCDGAPTKEKMLELSKSGMFKFWLSSGKISPIYLALSPFLADDCAKLAEACSISLALTRESVTAEVKEYFDYEFKHEHV